VVGWRCDGPDRTVAFTALPGARKEKALVKIARVEAFVVKIPRAERFAGGAGAVPGEKTPMLEGWSNDSYFRIGGYRSLFSPVIQTMMVRIETDTGIVGWGEAQAPIVPEVPKLIVDQLFGPLLLSRNPFDSQILWQEMYDATRERGHGTGFVLDAISAIDIALWDIKGKALNLSVSQLLGGAFRAEVPVYLSGLAAPTLQGQIELAQSYRDQGFSAFKVFLGFGLADDLARVEGLRGSLGDGTSIMVDAHWMYDVSTTLALGVEYERVGVRWLESPLVPEDLDGHARLTKSLRLPIAIGEGERTVYQFRQILEARAGDIMQPDVGRAGGITESMRIATLAHAHHATVAPHCGVGLGAYIAASVHLAASVPNLELLEYQPTMYSVANSLLKEPFEFHQGRVSVPASPGLGIEFDLDALYRYIQ
jgi:galactonate dehydratase